MLILCLFGVSAYLLADGSNGLQTWLSQNWDPIYEHICTSAISLCAGGARITRDEFERKASAHLLEITTLLVLLLLVLVVDFGMACMLQLLVARYGRLEQRATEMASLVQRSGGGAEARDGEVDEGIDCGDDDDSAPGDDDDDSARQPVEPAEPGGASCSCAAQAAAPDAGRALLLSLLVPLFHRGRRRSW